MRTRAWCTSVVLAILAVACGDQPTEVVPEREVAQGPGMARGAGMTVNATSSSDDGLSITTDKDDYQPGDTVYFSGAGWPANDVLDIMLTDEPQTHPPHEWTVNVREDGTFADSTYVVDEGDLDVTFTLLTTSRATERWLSVTFTDANITNNVSLTPNPVSVPRGGSSTTTVTVSFGGNTTNCTSPLSVAGLPTGATGSFNPTSVTGNSGSGNTPKTSILTITTTAGTALGPDAYSVTAGTGTGCDGVARTVNGTVIVFGPAAKLAFQQQPPATVASAAGFTPAVAVSVLDASNNVVANSSAAVTLAIGTNPGSGILSGVLTQNAVNGVATFPGLSIDKAGNGYTLTASSSALTGATSNTFNVTPGPATKLVFSIQPSGGTPNTAFITQPVVQVQDAAGNVKTSLTGSTASILLTITPATGTTGAALTCTTNPRAAVAGVATFAGCRINLAGTNYRLRATSAGLALADSDPFNITPNNQAPTVDAGTYTVVEGTELTLAPIVTDPDAGDVLTYKWTVNPTGIDTGGDCTFDDDTEKNAKITCTDDSQGGPAGKFTLTLEVNDGNGHTVADNADLTVSNAAPIANAGGTYTGNEGQAIQLNGSANDPGDNDDPHLTYLWTVTATGIDAGGACTFDDATKKNAKVTCTDDSNAGTFELTLVATDDDGAGSTASETTLDVGNLAPTANAGLGYTGEEGSAIQLGGSANDPGDNDDAHLTYQWTAITTGIDAGGTCTFDDDNDKNAKVTCTDDGAFKVRLVATDDDAGVSALDEATLTVGNAGPVANAGPDYTGVEGSPVQLNGSLTDAGSNDTHTWYWKYVAGPGVDAGATCSLSPNAAAEDPTITCTDDGVVELTLKVTDDDGSESSDQATLTLANADPVADAGPDYTGSEGTAVQLSGSVTDAGSNDTHTWYWKYVAGTGVDAGATCSFSSATAEDPTIACTDDGVVELTLKVTDDDGGEGSDKALLTLANVAPVADAGGPYTTTEGTAFELNGSATDKGANDVLSYKWTADVSGLDGGAGCTFDNDTHKDAKITCTDDGVVDLTLKVTDDDGDNSTSQTTLTLANADPVANAGPDYTGSEGTPVQLNGSVTDAGGNDTHTWFWKYVAGAGVDAGATCSLSSDSAEDPTITCTDDGVVELTLKATDDDGGEGIDKALLTLANVAPVANVGGPYTGGIEGTALQLNGSATDKGANDTHTYNWTVNATGIDAGGACTFDSQASQNPKITCTDDGTFNVTVVATDDDGSVSAGSQATITIANADPVIASPLTKPDGSPLPTTLIVAGSFSLKATFGDAGSNDHHTAEVDCGTGYSSLGAVTSPLTTSCTFATIGSKIIRVKVTDDDGGDDVETHEIVVKYNFDGFYAPVDRPNTMNVSKAGQAIPLKWRLTDANGAPVSDVVAVTIRAKDQGCATGTTTDLLEEYASGASGLQNHGDGRYQFNWKTPSTYVGSCKSIELVFGTGGLSYVDGPHAFFSFKK